MNPREKINTIMDEIENHLENEYSRIKMAIGDILNMIFWNNNSRAFATLEEKYLIIDYIINKYYYVDHDYDGGYHTLNPTDKLELRKLINRLRKNMGLWDSGENPPIEKQDLF